MNQYCSAMPTWLVNPLFIRTYFLDIIGSLYCITPRPMTSHKEFPYLDDAWNLGDHSLNLGPKPKKYSWALLGPKGDQGQVVKKNSIKHHEKMCHMGFNKHKPWFGIFLAIMEGKWLVLVAIRKFYKFVIIMNCCF
jgi:hypothetical protein